MNKNEETITIICDNEDCRQKYILSMDTLRAARTVSITCQTCGEIQMIRLNQNGDMEIFHIR